MGSALTLTKAGAYAGLAVVLLAYTVAVWQVRGWVEPEPKAPQTDTVRVDRTITERDTVTKTVVDEVVRYDTVQTTDTAFVPIPENWSPQGLIGTAPLDIEDDQATLTYWDHTTRQWTQNRYDLPTDTWGVGLRGDLTAGTWLHARSTVDVTRYTDVGPMDIETRIGAGYGVLITDEYRAGPVVTAGIQIGYDW